MIFTLKYKTPILKLEPINNGNYCISLDTGLFYKKKYIILDNIYQAVRKNHYLFTHKCVSKDYKGVSYKHKHLLKTL